MKCMCRPAKIETNFEALDREFRSARWTYHRLLDFEFEHQAHMDAAAELAAPSVGRLRRILAKLGDQEERRKRSIPGRWAPRARPDLRAAVRERFNVLKKIRDADPRYKAAKAWDRDIPENTTARGGARRQAGESDEQFEARAEKRPNFRNRREQYRHELYQTISIHYDTWNGLLASIDQARASVIRLRMEGKPSDYNRPRWDAPCTIYAKFKPKLGPVRVVEKGKPWWTLEMRLFDSWVRFRAKFGNWHELRGNEKYIECKLTRRKNGRGWEYSASVFLQGVEEKSEFSNSGIVALDWGHREKGHPREADGIRAFTWVGSDGASGEILLPKECRDLKDQVHEMKSRADKMFDARRKAHKIPERRREKYRSRLMRSGVRTEEENLWLRWEMRYDRRITAMSDRITDLRTERYLSEIRKLRLHYKEFVFEDETGTGHRELDKDEMTRHRKRQNRDMTARYLFIETCERKGAAIAEVPSRNTTRECPECGHLSENGPELLITCEGCGTTRDKDYGAARMILRRRLEALANTAAAE